MSFRRGGAKKRRDANEPAIRQALHAVYAETWQVSGEGLPDLLVRYQGRLFAFEVKSEKGTQTASQQQTNWPLVRTTDEALKAIGASR